MAVAIWCVWAAHTPPISPESAGGLSELSVSSDAFVSVVGTVPELSVFPDSSVEAISELFVSPDGSIMATEAVFELSVSSDINVCPVANTEIACELPVKLEETIEISPELSASPIMVKETFEFPVCLFLASETITTLPVPSFVVQPISQDPLWRSSALSTPLWLSSSPPWRSSAPTTLLWWSSAPPWSSSAAPTTLLWWSSAPPWRSPAPTTLLWWSCAPP
ncbi:hypothetical protein DPX16_21087 [Anabarilius grahami]|uniref:Uncharacterized protein n=1 Tax=Anabarilius grahami TaxID=495550 RepID=A0A3N0Z9N4_ANAGA|nr:hypothetical protein DPX16_21087 [Anabarilius grahami]